VYLSWKELLLDAALYGEAEAEDERFRLVLENFGRKIDEDKEYIFRDSDINEDLTDYVLLNQKRKELLLEGDKIGDSLKLTFNRLNRLYTSTVDIIPQDYTVDSMTKVINPIGMCGVKIGANFHLITGDKNAVKN
jgi:hypothetical protein